MGIEEEADRTLFIRNLDSRVTEELLFELFLQAGPLVRTKIPKDNDGKQKTFGFAVYRHEESAPYAVQLLNGAMLFGRTLHVQFRSDYIGIARQKGNGTEGRNWPPGLSLDMPRLHDPLGSRTMGNIGNRNKAVWGSSHGNSPGKTQNSNTANTPNPHGARSPVQFNSPPYTPPQTRGSFFSPDNNLQKHAMMNNMMWSLHTQHEQSTPQSLSRPGGGSRYDNTPYRQNNESRGRYQDESGSGRHQHYNHNDRSRHHDNRSMKRHHDDRGSYQDSRFRR